MNVLFIVELIVKGLEAKKNKIKIKKWGEN